MKTAVLSSFDELCLSSKCFKFSIINTYDFITAHFNFYKFYRNNDGLFMMINN